ncbi:helix-turn-helix transcriptional regulator [Alteromonas sp. a30]|uniref:helix-turn-helix transcriptional regulator n=1 Tax=Alteromonas sp. a30 TaxID=2730917 RepID=UPI00227EC54A|nr:helix-turn-helix transcriptional regulator [Alteromonas sp. a30]MCY7297404.1 helix-turn-helix domain-containing protein [Alteromonas sp. a30]
MTDDVIQRIELVLKSSRQTKAEFCRALGVSSPYFNNWKKDGFPTARLITAADILGVNVNWLAKGRGAIDDFRQSVGLQIAKARVSKNWTQSELAEKVNAQAGDNKIQLAGIKAIENGCRMDIEPELSVYAKVLGIDESVFGNTSNLLDGLVSLTDPEQLMEDYINSINDGIQMGILATTPETTPEALSTLARKFFNMHTGNAGLPVTKPRANKKIS